MQTVGKESCPYSAMETLKAKLRKLEAGEYGERKILPFGVKQIDQSLPEGGLSLGAIHEIAGGGNGAVHGAAAALFAAGIMARTSGQILWCIKRQDLFAPALTSVGLSMNRVIFAEANDEKALLACFEEGLRHGGVSGVVGEVSKLTMLASRRLQLAAEKSGAIGIVIRRWWKVKDADDFGNITAAHTRWRITALPSQSLPVQGVGKACWQLELLRCRAAEKATFEVEACDEKGNLAISSELVNGSGETQTWSKRAVT